ncbi:hypothetical protein NOR_08308 [Metarhizium rileyi]|uniref:Uncharacterized protein n=1 Tax=Metarhizium rileyi (strain RCEF 4871) TaxID=1649241 RepID=A0A166WJF7_METRR|nr:hypothetical protein NOR_08308 [Metarhizium rileyi RCEF 4871]
MPANVVGSWNNVFRIIFPSDTIPSDPYVEIDVPENLLPILNYILHKLGHRYAQSLPTTREELLNGVKADFIVAVQKLKAPTPSSDCQSKDGGGRSKNRIVANSDQRFESNVSFPMDMGESPHGSRFTVGQDPQIPATKVTPNSNPDYGRLPVVLQQLAQQSNGYNNMERQSGFILGGENLTPLLPMYPDDATQS